MDWALVLLLAFYAGAVVLARSPSKWALAVLGAGAFASVLPVEFAIWEEHVVWLMGIDGLICFACMLLWVNKIDMKAWAVLAIGTVKNVMAFVMLCSPASVPWELFAVSVNIAFVAQVLCAGGYCNAIGAWLDNRLSRLAPKRHKLLRGGV